MSEDLPVVSCERGDAMCLTTQPETRQATRPIGKIAIRIAELDRSIARAKNPRCVEVLTQLRKVLLRRLGRGCASP